MNRMIIMLAGAMLLTGAAPCLAIEGAPPKQVEITGVRNPVIQPYRIMAAGFTAMEKHRALAPQAGQLQFRLNPRAAAPAGIMDGLTLRLDGANTNVNLPIDSDGLFTLARSETADSDNAKLVLNRKQAYVRWVPHVRSPGVPPGFARLGDARMECQVLVGIVKKMINFALEIGLNGLIGRDWCGAEKFQIPTFSGQRVTGATLIHGGERIPLRVEEKGAGFFAPISDQRYGNDDLIELNYAAGAPEA